MGGRTSIERRLRRALIGVSMLCAVLVLLLVAVVVVWRLYLLGPEGDPFTRGPHLTRVTETTATLRWRLARSDEAVDVRAVGPDGRQVVARDGVLRGLSPGARYGWTASVGGVTRAAGTLRTAPRDLRRPVRFAVFADSGPGDTHQWAVGRLAAALDPEFAVVAGDLISPIAIPALLDRSFFRPYAELARRAPLYGTVGDHDIAWRGGAAIADALELPGGGDRYALDHGPVRIVALGLEGRADDLPFLRQALRRPGGARRFVVVHRPLKEGNPLLPALRAGRVDALLVGHLHLYERRVLDGVLQITAGTGGASRSDEFTPRTAAADVSLPLYGAVRVDAGAERVAYTFIDEAGRVRDRLVRP